MRYSKGALQTYSKNNASDYSAGEKGSFLPAVSVLQKAAPEEELQMKKVVQKAAPEEELQMKTVVQKAAPEEELQMKSMVQKVAPEEELQMKAVVQKAAPEEELQMKSIVQKAASEEELQMKSVVQKAEPEEELQMKSIVQRKENKTGMPDHLKSGIESLSGMDMSDVKVHYNSSQPAQLQALAYAQGNEIHIGPGQEQHLAHEAWHVVQQRQGRVKPTMQMKESVAVNDDPGLEHEADVMGAKALQMKAFTPGKVVGLSNLSAGKTIQRYAFTKGTDNYDYGNDFYDHLSARTGAELRAAAVAAAGKGYWTLVNRASFEGGTFDVTTAPSEGYDFGISIDGVEAISVSNGEVETIDHVVVDGYTKTTKNGNDWYKITHLRAAQ